MKTYHISLLEPKTISWWRARRSKIDFSPSYQRKGRIWSDSDKAYLIDSILNGFDIPKIYVADFSWGSSPLNSNGAQFAIVDGKQRFEALFDFYDGKVRLSPEFIYAENPTLRISGLSYKDILANYPEVAEVFDQYNLSVVGIRTESTAVIEGLFLRLNRSKPLTGAEMRNAIGGQVPAIARELAKQPFFTECVKFQTGRGQDWNTVIKLLLFEYVGELFDTKKATLDSFAKDTPANETLELAARRTDDALELLSEIFLPKDPLLSSAGLVPNYYWFVRSLKEKDYAKVRSFLVLFDEARRSVRDAVREGNNVSNDLQSFVQFEAFNRSTNDVGSHIGRHAVLTDWWAPAKRRQLESLL